MTSRIEIDFSSGHRCTCMNPSGVPDTEHCLTGRKYQGRRTELYKIRSLAILWRIWELYSSGQLDVRLTDGTQILLPVGNGPINPPDHPTSPLTADFSKLYGLPGNTYMERVPALQLMQGDLILGYAPTSSLEQNLNEGLLAECLGFLDPTTSKQGRQTLSVPVPVTFKRGASRRR